MKNKNSVSIKGKNVEEKNFRFRFEELAEIRKEWPLLMGKVLKYSDHNNVVYYYGTLGRLLNENRTPVKWENYPKEWIKLAEGK
jgi:hypothetical protein